MLAHSIRDQFFTTRRGSNPREAAARQLLLSYLPILDRMMKNQQINRFSE